MQPNDISDEVKQRITDAIRQLYGESSVKSAFITGSIPAGKARPDSDIDIFVCYDDSVVGAATHKQAFITFYLDLHKELGRVPDTISPGELLLYSELAAAIRRIEAVVPCATLQREDFDAICWAGMLISKQYTLIQDTPDIEELKKIAETLVRNWAQVLAPDIQLTKATGEHTDIDKVLRKTISSPGYYDAH